MSTRIALATFGSLGDIHPILALAHELKSRGHQPIVATSELYRAKIENAGIAFHALRPDLPPPSQSRAMIAKVMDARSGSEYLFRELLMPALRDSYQDLRALAETCDLLISHPATPAAPIVAQALKMKWLSVALAPASLWSVHDAPMMVPLSLIARWKNFHSNVPLQRAIKRLALRVTSRWVAPVEELRQEVGLPCGENPIFSGQHSPHGVLALFSRVLAAPQEDWPAQTSLCGYCFYDQLGTMADSAAEYSAAGLHPEMENFLQAGAAPLVFTLGSAAVFDAHDFFAQSAEAAKILQRRALLLIGNEENRPTNLKINDAQISAFDYAPFGEVFKRAAIVVHQGGAGTTGQVLHAGVPSLIMPYSHDQPDHAARLERLGVGRSISRRKYSAARAAREIDLLLQNGEYSRRALQISSEVQAENGPRAAAEAIERVLQSR